MESSAAIEQRTTSAEIEKRLARLNEKLGRYIPPRDEWTPVDEAIYQPADLLRVRIDEAKTMQLKAVKYAFTRQYTLNKLYRRYCDTRGVTPDDIRTDDDLEKIPLIPDVNFKQHPSGKDFAVLDCRHLHWRPAQNCNRGCQPYL